MASYAGFAEESFDEVFIILDKMDKIGPDGVRDTLLEAGFAKESVEKYTALFAELEKEKDPVAFLADRLGEYLPEECKDNLTEIDSAVNAAKTADFTLLFDPTLVRGMSYYTGTIFEVELKEFHSSCGGGGRYDKMIGKFTGSDTPACGFSIGFERIITILLENNFKVPGQGEKTAFLIEKGMPSDRVNEIFQKAEKLRREGGVVLIARMNKNKKFQKEQLAKEGYTQYEEFYVNSLK